MKGSNMRIIVRLGIGFGSFLLLMAVVGLTNLHLINRVDHNLKAIVSNSHVRIEKSYEALMALNKVQNAVKQSILSDDQTLNEHALRDIQTGRREYNEAIAKLETLDTSDRGKTIIAKLREITAHAGAVNDKALDTERAGRHDEAIDVLVHELIPANQKATDVFAELLNYQQEHLQTTFNEAVASGDRARLVNVLFGIVSTIIGIVTAIVITRSIRIPLLELVAANKRLAAGDLTFDIPLTGTDEIGQLAESSRSVMTNMRDVLGKMADVSGELASASSQLQKTAEQMAAGAEEVALQTNSVATASEEMSATSTDIARNCCMAAESSQQSTTATTRGVNVVQGTILGMSLIADRVKQTAQTIENLGKCSEQIGEIVATIEDIADQTNLLALNAAIEAARAGEQGRGFAVVADEVRALAERTTKATKEIAGMIKTIQSETMGAVTAMQEGVVEVEKGTAASHESGKALDDILSQINEVTMQINQIATAAEEQTAVTGEITMNVQNVTDVVSRTAQGVNEIAAASAQLASDAGTLQVLVQRFKFV
ncbi:MAG TPA: methyl-accepting chemotaxis protein [Desulfuromonadaceae bacterium]